MENHRSSYRKARRNAATCLAACLLVSACGGSGAGSGGGGESSTAVTVSGSVNAGPVQSASLVIKDTGDNVVAGPVTTASDGSFIIDVPSADLNRDLVFEASNGSYTDEATGEQTTLGRLAAYAPARSLGGAATVHLGPGTTILHDLIVQHGNTHYQANRAFGAAFGFTPDLSIAPVNGGAAEASLESRLACLRGATFSQLSADLGLNPGRQVELLGALSRDLADGTLDGANSTAPVTLPGGGTLPEDIQSCFERSLLAFLANPNNRTDLKADQIGLLPFAKVALSENYRVEYLPLDPGAALGKTPFQLQITERSSGDPAVGLSVALEPVMHMASLEHSTPFEVINDSGDGFYDCAVYYLMAGGEDWGYWRLHVAIDDGLGVESVDFYPTVGTPSYAVLRGQDDLTAGLGDGEKRAYYLIDDGLTLENLAAGTYGFGLFVAAREDDWNYPAVTVGLPLQDENGALWTVADVRLEFSLDGTQWTTAADEGGGHWSVSGINGLDPNAAELTIYVRLHVNGEQKTTDGAPESATNGHAQLVTGGASCCF